MNKSDYFKMKIDVTVQKNRSKGKIYSYKRTYLRMIEYFFAIHNLTTYFY